MGTIAVAGVRLAAHYEVASRAGTCEHGVVGRAAEVSQSRPFYTRFADVYDLLIDDPVEPWVEAVIERTSAAPSSMALLDAGCGTGRHAAAFAARGFLVTLADASPELLALAQQRCPRSPALLVDLCTLTESSRFDVITCRGVLNDLLTDGERDAALTSMAKALRPGGRIFCDVRDATASRVRALSAPTLTKTVPLPTGELIFSSTSRWTEGLLLVEEEHLVQGEGSSQRSRYSFAMRPWTEHELSERCTRAGLIDVYVEPGVGHATADRYFVHAARPR